MGSIVFSLNRASELPENSVNAVVTRSEKDLSNESDLAIPTNYHPR